MRVSCLKNYTKYIHVIKLYAKILRIKIVYKDYPCDGSYVPSRRQLVIDNDLDEPDEIATLLHELGHHLDFEMDYPASLARAYTSYYKNKHSKKQYSLVKQRERAAWDYGKVIAKKLGIRLGKWYAIIRRDSLRTYKS